MIKAIYFDVGGVIVNFTQDQYFSYLSRKTKINTRRLKHVLVPLIIAMELGRMDLDHTERIFADHFHVDKSEMKWAEAFRKIAKKNVNVVKLLRKLSKNYKIGIISNISKSRHREACALILDSLPIKNSIASCYVGLRKPGPKIYRLALKNLHIRPGESIFIDDKKENVIGARNVGMNSIHYVGYKKLLKDLKKFNIS